MHLAMRVLAAEVGRFVFGPVNELVMFWADVVSTYGGFWEYVLLLVMLAILVEHFGKMYIVRQEYVPLFFFVPLFYCLLCFCLCLSAGSIFWLMTFSRPAEDNPHAEENASDNSSDDNFFSLDDFYANESTPEEETWALDPDLDLEDFVARAA